MSLCEAIRLVKSGTFTCNGNANVVIAPGVDLTDKSVVYISPVPITGAAQGNPPGLVSSALNVNTFTVICAGANVAVYRYLVFEAL